tara:strand:+ start:1435 stop:1620 length:186 start_codon:yes stop_codon:yes gene_type:complete
MDKTTKLIASITALLVAIGTLIGTITITLGGGKDESPYQGGMTIVLNSPEAYEEFLKNHPG